MVANLNVAPEHIVALCRRYHIHRLSFFGSVLRDDFRPNSDVDMLVEFEPGHTPGWEVVDIEQEFSRLFGGRKVDMVNPKYLNRHLKKRVLETAVLQYEASHAT
ncbi:MAG: nucleotidyltransferase family protein [Phycisphaerae bacterium]|nr:nucleotidyltransferase family protein [Phycisphaerae bacterium]